MADKQDQWIELAHLINYGIRKIGEQLIQEADALREALELPDDPECDENLDEIREAENGVKHQNHNETQEISAAQHL